MCRLIKLLKAFQHLIGNPKLKCLLLEKMVSYVPLARSTLAITTSHLCRLLYMHDKTQYTCLVCNIYVYIIHISSSYNIRTYAYTVCRW